MTSTYSDSEAKYIYAHGYYTGNNSMQGWNYLEVNGVDESLVTSTHEFLKSRYAMGYLEGTLTCSDMIAFYPNFYHDLFGYDRPGAQSLAFLRENYRWAKKMAEDNYLADTFWYAQLQTFRQLTGLFDGFMASPCVGATSSDASSFLKSGQKSENKKKKRSSYSGGGEWVPNMWDSLEDEPTFEHLLLLNAWGDMYQIATKFAEPGRNSRLFGRNKQTLIERCSAFIKLLPDYSDVFFAHNTWDGYGSLGPRVFKHYAFPLVPAMETVGEPLTRHDVYFSSSPALLSSVDDFFVLKGRANLGVTETTNSLFELKILSLVTPHSLLSWMRSTGSNQAAESGASWVQLFARYQSGTYTNQWMVLDLSLFTPGSRPLPGFLSIIEEVPGTTHAQDMTEHLLQRGFWKSFNSPYFDDIQQLAGYRRLCEAGARTACYEQAPRSELFEKLQGSVRGVDDVKSVMQYNHWFEDALSKNDSCHAIACRGDLEPDPESRGAFGALDAKISSAAMARQADNLPYKPSVLARLGPSTSEGLLPVFCWSSFAGEGGSHAGQPNCFDFQWVLFGGGG